MASLSIILTAHNCAAKIRRTLASLEEALAFLREPKSESVAVPVEVLLVDDGSTDGTNSILADFARDRPTWKLLSQPRATSPSCARNLGVDAARGDLLLFLDGDDLFLPNHIVECRKQLADPAVDFVKTGVKLADPVHPYWHKQIEFSIVINLAVRRQCHDFIGGFLDLHLMRRAGGQYLHELDLCFKQEDVYYNVLLDKLFRGTEVPSATVEYCRHPGNSYDVQYAKFCRPPGEYHEELSPEERLRRTMCEALVQHRLDQLKKQRATLTQEADASAPKLDDASPAAPTSPATAKALGHFQRQEYKEADSVCTRIARLGTEQCGRPTTTRSNRLPHRAA